MASKVTHKERPGLLGGEFYNVLCQAPKKIDFNAPYIYGARLDSLVTCKKCLKLIQDKRAVVS